MGTLGKHYLLDLKDCNGSLLDDIDYIKSVLYSVVEDTGNEVIGEAFHTFLPQGLSGMVLVSGAHLCIHTWPEHCYAAIDIFSYGDPFHPDDVSRSVVEKLESKNPAIVELKRGV